MTKSKTDNKGVRWTLDDTVIKVTDGDPTTGKILDLGKDGCPLILIKIEGHKAEWVDVHDVVKYEDKSGELE